MKMLTEHFSDLELKLPGDPDTEAAAVNLLTLCMEPIRAQYSLPIIITSAYRTYQHNLDVGGEPTSFHLYNDGKAAIDFVIPSVNIQNVFDWIRLLSGLPFDQVILEYSHGEPDIVHIQTQVGVQPRRMALVGQTHGTQHGRVYEHVEVSGPDPSANPNPVPSSS